MNLYIRMQAEKMVTSEGRRAINICYMNHARTTPALVRYDHVRTSDAFRVKAMLSDKHALDEDGLYQWRKTVEWRLMTSAQRRWLSAIHTSGYMFDVVIHIARQLRAGLL